MKPFGTFSQRGLRCQQVAFAHNNLPYEAFPEEKYGLTCKRIHYMCAGLRLGGQDVAYAQVSRCTVQPQDWQQTFHGGVRHQIFY